MKKATLVILSIVATLALSCATIDRFGPLCELVLAKQVCDSMDIIGAVVQDTGDLTGEDESEATE